jgi:hypothetical protein
MALREMWVAGTLDVSRMLKQAMQPPTAPASQRDPQPFEQKPTEGAESCGSEKAARGRRKRARDAETSSRDLNELPATPSAHAQSQPRDTHTMTPSPAWDSVVPSMWGLGFEALQPVRLDPTDNIAPIVAEPSDPFGGLRSVYDGVAHVVGDATEASAFPDAAGKPRKPRRRSTRDVRLDEVPEGSAAPADSDFHPIVDDTFLQSVATAAAAAATSGSDAPKGTAAAEARGGGVPAASQQRRPSVPLPQQQTQQTRSFSSASSCIAPVHGPADDDRILHASTLVDPGAVTAAAAGAGDAQISSAEPPASPPDSSCTLPGEPSSTALTPVEVLLRNIDPLTTPIEAIVVRVDKITGAVDVHRVVSLPTAFSAFLAALRLHEVLKMLPAGGGSGAAKVPAGDVAGPLLERLVGRA